MGGYWPGCREGDYEGRKTDKPERYKCFSPKAEDEVGSKEKTKVNQMLFLLSKKKVFVG